MDIDDISAGITGFIDILGFGGRVLSAKRIDDIKDIKKLVQRIQSEFDFDTKDSLTKEVHSIYNKTILAFSDCVVVNIPLQSKATEYEGTFDPIMSELAGFAYAQGACAQDKLFLRGGLDIGWWHQSGSTLISQSMVRAYKAEAKANVPVIALTNDLYNFFVNHKHRQFYSSDYDPVKRILRKYEEGEGDNRIEFWYLDYISICVESIGWQRSKEQLHAYRSASPEEKGKIMNQGYRENIDYWLEHHARNIEAAYTNASNEKVKGKYEWLSEYHNEIAATFTNTKDCICTVG